MKVNIYYGGRGLIDDPAIYVIDKMTEVLEEIRVSVTRYNLYEQKNGLCRNVCLKSGRFNQHVATGCILVEAGNNKNTLDEVLSAMPYLADAIAQALEK